MKRLRTSQLDEVFKRPVEIVLVDFGGVLSHYEPTAESEALTATHLGASTSLTTWLFDHPASWDGIIGRLTADEVLRQIARQANLPLDVVQEIWSAFIAANVADVSLIDSLQRYRARSKIFILSNYWSNGREVIFSKIPENAFDGLLLSSELKMRKPDQAIWNHVITSFSRPPHTIALLDDEEQNVRAANVAGLDGYLWVER